MDRRIRVIHLRRQPLAGNDGIAAIIKAIEDYGAKVDRIDNPYDAIDLFKGERPPLPMVLSTDEMLLHDDELRVEARKYVRKAGVIVAIWGTSVPHTNMDKLFDFFGLSWRSSGNLHRAECNLNPSYIPFDTSKLADYSMRCLFLKDVPTRDCLYARAPETEPGHFSGSFTESETQDAVAVAFTEVHDGQFGYIGDEGNDAETVDVVLAILGLL